MKKKKNSDKKLRLNPETIRLLDVTDRAAVVGGEHTLTGITYFNCTQDVGDCFPTDRTN